MAAHRDRVADRVLEPVPGGAVADVDGEDRRHSGQEHFTQARIAREEAAYEARLLAAAAPTPDLQAACQQVGQGLRRVDRGAGRSVAQQMRVAVREGHDVSGPECQCRTTGHLHVRASLGHQVIDDDLFGTGGEQRKHDARRRRAHAPRRREFGVEEHRAAQAHTLQHF
jgi:hypothetical protein